MKGLCDVFRVRIGLRLGYANASLTGRHIDLIYVDGPR